MNKETGEDEQHSAELEREVKTEQAAQAQAEHSPGRTLVERVCAIVDQHERQAG